MLKIKISATDVENARFFSAEVKTLWLVLCCLFAMSANDCSFLIWERHRHVTGYNIG